jgi:hypothetical protein
MDPSTAEAAVGLARQAIESRLSNPGMQPTAETVVASLWCLGRRG